MLCLGAIAYQDIKDREVYGWLFLVTLLFTGSIHLHHNPIKERFVMEISLNLLLLSMVMILLFLYTSHIAKKKFLNHSIGLGDLLFFIVMAVSLPTYSFVVILATGLLFSLIIFLFGKQKWGWTSVPLAGLLSLYVMVFLIIGLSTTPSMVYFV
jgi:hypothetical protein